MERGKIIKKKNKNTFFKITKNYVQLQTYL